MSAAFGNAGSAAPVQQQQNEDVWRWPGGSAEADAVTAELAAFLREDLQHLFDDQGIDQSRYDEVVAFEDPITRYASLSGYLFNIAMLRHLFAPTFILHDIRRTGEWEVTTRWTMGMQLTFSPIKSLWNPQLVFTGTSVMGINPATRRFNSHRDTWDAVQQQQYFSVEAFLHMLSQLLDIKRVPQLGGTAFILLRKTASYEVRQYDSAPALEASKVASSSSASSNTSTLFAVTYISSMADENTTAAEAAKLRAKLEGDGVRVAPGWALARDADGNTPLRHNELLMPLQEFNLWQ